LLRNSSFAAAASVEAAGEKEVETRNLNKEQLLSELRSNEAQFESEIESFK
tara:strand:+ start:370 stop:522 length:153 start_codon:yes stop_codon:yes gene_type:complete